MAPIGPAATPATARPCRIGISPAVGMTSRVPTAAAINTASSPKPVVVLMGNNQPRNAPISITTIRYSGIRTIDRLSSARPKRAGADTSHSVAAPRPTRVQAARLSRVWQPLRPLQRHDEHQGGDQHTGHGGCSHCSRIGRGGGSHAVRLKPSALDGTPPNRAATQQRCGAVRRRKGTARRIMVDNPARWLDRVGEYHRGYGHLFIADARRDRRARQPTTRWPRE